MRVDEWGEFRCMKKGGRGVCMGYVMGGVCVCVCVCGGQLIGGSMPQFLMQQCLIVLY